MSEKTFDYAIIGAGAAGLQLALAFTEDPFFASKSILLLDADQKEFNDKTWCFWENGEGPWESLITKTWGKTVFADQKGTLHLESAPYTYKMLRSIDFYAFAKSKIASSKNINWLHDRVVGTKELPDGLQISTKSGNHKVSHCFDSRIPEQFIKGGDSYHRVQQHFKGQVLRFKKPVFDPGSFLMMDYRLVFENKTSFMYILPLNAKEALLEYTFFSPNLEQDIVYKEQIKAYIKKYIKEETYEILEEEAGVIPMSNFPFHQYHTAHLTKIGTAGGWVRASTGYSFNNAGKNVRKLIENIKSGKEPSAGLFQKKYHFFDTLLLNVLFYENELGPAFFGQLYRNNKLQTIFRFLDGESTLTDDLKIITSVNPLPFLRAIYRELRS